MTKEFVTYEQAVALKELGFDEECFGYYVITTLLITTDNVYNSKEIPVIKAPLKQQVFRWFREKYNQNSFIELVYQDRLKFDYVLYVNKKEEECENYGDGPFNTYDEAENACIDKLIKTAKQQDK